MLALIDYTLAIDDKASQSLPVAIAQQRHIERKEMLANFETH